jgi:membrane protein required for beta-lactamase induction
MTFIAILIGLAVERFWGGVQRFRDMALYDKCCRRVRAWYGESELFDGALGVLLLNLPLVGVVLWLQAALSHGWLVILGLLFAIVAFITSIGPRDLEAQMQAVIDAEQRSDGAALSVAVSDMLGDAYPVEEQSLHRELLTTFLQRVNDWLFGVLFWFVLLGPAGAILYRISCELDNVCYRDKDQSDFAAAARVLHGVLAWAPARLVGLAFGIMGNFVEMQARRLAFTESGAGAWMTNNRRVVLGSGLGALSLHDTQYIETGHLAEALALVKRTVVLWLTVIAFLAIGGWLF